MSTKLRRRGPLAALAALTLLGTPVLADDVPHGLLPAGASAHAAEPTVQAQAVNLIRDASRRSGITAEAGYGAYELAETGPGGNPWIRNRLVDGQTGAGSVMPNERSDGQLGGFPLNTDRWVVWYERFIEMPTTSLDRWQVVGPEIHGPNVSPFDQALLMLEVGPDKRRRLNANAGRASVRYFDLGPIELGRVYTYKMHVRLSAGSDGLIEIWQDGVKKVTITGPTIFQATSGSYWKEANYRNANIDGPMTHDFSSLRIYDGDPGGFGGGVAPPPAPAPDPAPAPAPDPAPTPAPPPSSDSTTPALNQPAPTGTLQPNPLFAAGLTGWSSWQGTASLESAADGSKVARVARATGSTFTLGETTPAVAAPAVGARYRAVAWVRAANAQSVGKQARVYARQMGRQDVQGSAVNLTTAWQQSTVDITANSTTGIDTRVGFANAVAGDAMQVAMISTAPATATAPAPAPAPAPPPASGAIAQEGFEGAVPGTSGSAFQVVRTSGNLFATSGAPVRNGVRSGRFEQAGSGNQISIRTGFAARRDATSTASVHISRNTLGLNRSRSIMRITSGPGNTNGPRHEVGIFRDSAGAVHWAVWSVGKDGRYTNARLGSAPKLNTWQTLKLESQWDRTGAGARLTIDGKEILQPTTVDLSGVKANNFEVGLNYSNPADKAIMHVDDVALTEAAMGATAVGHDGTASRRAVGALSAAMLDLRAPKVLRANKPGGLTFRAPARVRYTVSVLKGRAEVAGFSRTTTSGLNKVGFRAPRAAGTYTVRVQFPGSTVSAKVRVTGRR
jgi:hypothetical protein